VTLFLVQLEPTDGSDEVLSEEVEALNEEHAAELAVEKADTEGNGTTYRAYDIEEV
jgi:hypothetical protein